MEAFVIMTLVLFEVALWQWRVAITVRGNLLGGLIDRRVSKWHVSVRVFAPADTDLVPALRDRGWPVTATRGIGHRGPVEVLFIAIDQRRTGELEHALRSLAPDASWTIERISSSRGLLAVAA